MRADHITRIDYGYFVRPASETGTGHPRVEPVLGYLVAHPAGYVLFDTGMGIADAETEAHYRPRRRPVAEALRGGGAGLDDVRCIVNCHLHFDHCGGNPAFAGRPIVVQAVELVSARQTDYTIPELVEFGGVTYEEIDGEVEILPGIWIIPTPGHTEGHQSLVIQCEDGTVVLAGQAHDSASEYSADVRAVLAGAEINHGERPPVREWVERLQRFDPRRILFAHDLSVVEPLR